MTTMLRRLLLLVSLAGLLSGCASYASYPTMAKEDMSAYDRDNYQCHRERREEGFAFGPPAFMLGHRIHTDILERDNYVLCMRARGYTAADERVAAGPTPTPQQPAQVAERPATPAQPGLNGTYSGEITGQARGQAFTMRVTFTLVQSGEQLVGVWNTTGGTSGTVQGVVSGSQVSDFRAKQVNPCEGAFAGAAVIEAGRLRGSYTGVDCQGPVTASFTVSRQ